MMRRDDDATQVEPQACSHPRGSRDRTIGLEQHIQGGWIQSLPFVLYGYDRTPGVPFTLHRHTDPHVSSRRRVLDRVVEQIDQHPIEPSLIRRDLGRNGIDGDFQSSVGDLGPHQIHHLANHLVHPEPRIGQGDLAVGLTVQVKDVLHDANGQPGADVEVHDELACLPAQL